MSSYRFLIYAVAVCVASFPAGAQILAQQQLTGQSLLGSEYSPAPTPREQAEKMEAWLHGIEFWREAPMARGAVSAQELRKPLEGKALKQILTAQELLKKGETLRAIKVLETAKDDPSAAPHALSLLGAEHMKAGKVDEAIVELQEANRLMPGKAANHSNLALAYGWKGQSEQGLAEARKALQLDPSQPKTRYILGQILLQMGRREEAEFHLRIAANDLTGARALLEQYFPK